MFCLPGNALTVQLYSEIRFEDPTKLREVEFRQMLVVRSHVSTSLPLSLLLNKSNYGTPCVLLARESRLATLALHDAIT